MRHDLELCDQSGEDQNKAWLDGPITRVKNKSEALKPITTPSFQTNISMK